MIFNDNCSNSNLRYCKNSKNEIIIGKTLLEYLFYFFSVKLHKNNVFRIVSKVKETRCFFGSIE